MKTYHALSPFLLSQYCFSLSSLACMCVSLDACVYVHAHFICAPVFVRGGIISVVQWLNKNGWNDIQSSDIKHQRPVELWRIDRLQEQRQRWLRGWKWWKKEIDEADRRQAASGSAANSVWGLRLWALCQSGSGGKVAPLRKRVESEWERDARECVGH